MADYETPRIGKPSRKQLRRFSRRFSLASLMILVTLTAVAITYITYRRERGNDFFHQTLSGVARFGVTIYEDKEVTWIDRLLGSSEEKRVGESVFFSSQSLKREVKIGRVTASRLAKNLSTESIRQLEFRDATIEPDAVCFFENWKQVNSLRIRDTPLPESWIGSIKRMARLEELVISGGLCSLEPESLVGCKNLKSLKLCHRNINSARLKKLKQLLPGVQIQLLGSFDQQFSYPDESTTLSEHDAEAHASLKQSLDRLKQSLGSLEPPAKNRFNTAATETEIAKYEKRIGVPLHPSLRALFEIHNGQPTSYDELILFEKLLTIDESIDNMNMELNAAGIWWEDNYNFNPSFDWMSNPNLIGVGSSEADVLYVNNVSGNVYYAYEGMTYISPTLEDYFDSIHEEVVAGRFKRNIHGCICLTDHSTSIGKKRWRMRQLKKTKASTK